MADVLEKLRDAGRREAELLFREHRNHPATPLPSLSERISNAINSVTDAVLKILDDAPPGVSERQRGRGRRRRRNRSSPLIKAAKYHFIISFG